MTKELPHIAVTQSRLKVLEAAERVTRTHIKLRNEFARPEFEQSKVRELLAKLANQMIAFERISTAN
jgi:IS1 family transposase